jgi:hypothetical protein
MMEQMGDSTRDQLYPPTDLLRLQPTSLFEALIIAQMFIEEDSDLGSRRPMGIYHDGKLVKDLRNVRRISETET